MTQKPDQQANKERLVTSNEEYDDRWASLTAWKREPSEAGCHLALLPLELKLLIMSHLNASGFSHLGQTSQFWYHFVIPKLYTWDASVGNSFAISWAASNAVDEISTRAASRTLNISQLHGGQVNEIQQGFPREVEGLTYFETSTALHLAVVKRNWRIANRLLEMGARLDIPCSGDRWFWCATGSDVYEPWARLRYFGALFEGESAFGPWFPLFLAFFQNDPITAEALITQGASRDAMMITSQDGTASRISILHFAAADTSVNLDEWRFLFDAFPEHINEVCTEKNITPLQAALRSGCIQGMKILVQNGADTEANPGSSRTPLVELVDRLRFIDPLSTRLQRHLTCLWEFVRLGANVNPDGDSVLVSAILYFMSSPVNYGDAKRVIDLLLEHGADPNSISYNGLHGMGSYASNVIHELVAAILLLEADATAMEILRTVLSDLFDKGLDVTTTEPWLPSPLATAILNRDAQPEWLCNMLYEYGAKMHGREANAVFLHWCYTPRLWNHYDVSDLAWRISPSTVTLCYRAAFSRDTSALCDTLVRMPLAAPLDHGRMARAVFRSEKKWAWRTMVGLEVQGDSITWVLNSGENMLHLTVRFFDAVLDYSAAETIDDISRLIRRGVNITLPDIDGHNPLELFRHLAIVKAGASDVLEFLEGEVERESVLEAQQQCENLEIRD
ncbi:uncharacterized protein CPUR_03998 [Claviceps purpurea 20.1]|uniref:F-box domain-containing protein n=1 Tax=Claviceps purpurea (strain 20.1) TaxID=1111077 RepID=M1W5W1_CLAP2|nr:uncharacterized protein CPUR_03998 [Claviceps purpurea 20.1]